jgi:hypothetical protein
MPGTWQAWTRSCSRLEAEGSGQEARQGQEDPRPRTGLGRATDGPPMPGKGNLDDFVSGIHPLAMGHPRAGSVTHAARSRTKEQANLEGSELRGARV